MRPESSACAPPCPRLAERLFRRKPYLARQIFLATGLFSPQSQIIAYRHTTSSNRCHSTSYLDVSKNPNCLRTATWCAKRFGQIRTELQLRPRACVGSQQFLAKMPASDWKSRTYALCRGHPHRCRFWQFRRNTIGKIANTAVYRIIEHPAFAVFSPRNPATRWFETKSLSLQPTSIVGH